MTGKLSEDVARAIAALSTGKYRGNVVSLLERAERALTRQERVDDVVAKMRAREAWESLQIFQKRLAVILAEKIRVEDLLEGEELMWCYVTDFYATPESRRDPEYPREATVTIRHADIRISTDEDLEHPSWVRIEYSDRYGCHYREPRAEMWTFPERWLWVDDWREEFRRRSLQRRLHAARRHLRDASSRVEDLRGKVLAEAETRELKLTREIRRLTDEMQALGLPIPPDEEAA